MTSRIRLAVLLAAFALVATGCPEDNPGNADTGPVVGADRTSVPPDAEVANPADAEVVAPDASTEPPDATTAEPADATTAEPADASTPEPSDATVVNPTDGSTTTPPDATVDVSPDAGTTPDTGPAFTGIVECNVNLPTPANGATCDTVAGTNAKVLLTGTVLLNGAVLRGGQVLVGTDGKIACVACDCSAGASGAAQVTCPNAVVSPGLINTHDHITYANSPPPSLADPAERFEHRHDWRKGKFGHTDMQTKYNLSGGANGDTVSFAELRFALGGATSTVGSGAANGFLRNLDKTYQEGLPREVAVTFDTFPLGDSGGTQAASGCGSYSLASPDFTKLDAYLPHIGEGINAAAHNEFVCTQAGAVGGKDLTTNKSSFIHGIAAKPLDVALMARDQARLIWSPRSNVSLYGDTARVPMYHRMGVLVALGTDWLPSGSMNLLRELKCAADLNETYFDQYFSDEDLWRMVTYNAALATGTADELGELAAGKVADIAVFATNGKVDYRAVIEAEPKDVALVLRGGKPLYGDANAVTAVDSSSGCEALDVCTKAKKVCVQRELSKSLATLTGNETSNYALFFCGGAPTNEPSCQPQRLCSPAADCPANMTCVPTCPVNASVNGSNLYDGTPRAGDMDGDGIDDAADNCDKVFNPIRPMDDGQQADADDDGVGDACDPCPLQPDVTSCSFDANDVDGDTLPNATDTCPSDYDPSNADRDTDGKGDVCDPCPDFSNPGANGCAATIYDIKKGLKADGEVVYVANALVTGVYSKGFFMQVKETDAGWQGADYSGIYVYTGTAPTVAVGDRVTVPSATLSYWFGEWELTKVTLDPVTVHGEAAPAPAVVTDSALIATGGSRVAALEGVLVRVDNVTVDSISPPVDPADKTAPREFTVKTAGSTAAVRVHDWLYAWPDQTAGDAYSSVVGILHWDYNNSKIEPRGEGDLVKVAPKLASLTPATGAKIYAGSSNSVTFPTPIQVNLDKPAVGDTVVQVTSSSTDLAVHGTVTVLNGQTSAVVYFDTVNAAANVTLTATLGTDTATATVDVVTVTAVTGLVVAPATAKVSPGGTLDMTVTADVEAPPGGLTVELSLTQPSGAGCSLSATTVTIPANLKQVHFNFIAGTVEATGADAVKVQATAASVTSNEAVIEVAIVYPSSLVLAPETATVAPGGKLAMTVTADVNVYADFVVTLTVGTGGSAPATVTIPAGSKVGNFEFTALADELPEVTVVASTAAPVALTSNTAKVEVKTAAVGSCDVSGLHLVQSASALDWAIPAGTVIPGGSYLIVARNADQAAFQTFFGVTLAADVVFLNSATAIPQLNGDETYSLKDGTAVVDGPTIAIKAGGGDSIQRVAYGSASDAASWTVAVAGAGTSTPGASVLTRDPTKNVVISEVSDATGTGNFVYEFIELYCPK